MAASAVALCNMALSHLGNTTSRLESFSEKSVEARQCVLWYDTARREVLESFDWPFARQKVSLALHADAAPDEWGFRYALPSDNIAVRKVWNPLGERYDAVPYALVLSDDGSEVTLVTDMEDAQVFYTRDVTIPTIFSAAFDNTIAHYLASKLAMPLTAKLALAQQESKMAQSALRSAAGSSGNQQVDHRPREADWVRERGGYSGFYGRVR